MFGCFRLYSAASYLCYKDAQNGSCWKKLPALHAPPWRALRYKKNYDFLYRENILRKVWEILRRSYFWLLSCQGIHPEWQLFDSSVCDATILFFKCWHLFSVRPLFFHRVRTKRLNIWTSFSSLTKRRKGHVQAFKSLKHLLQEVFTFTHFGKILEFRLKIHSSWLPNIIPEHFLLPRMSDR